MYVLWYKNGMSLGYFFLWKILIYPYKNKYVLNRGPTLLKSAQPALTLGVKSFKFVFTPKVSAGGVILGKVGPLLNTYFCL